MKLPSVLMAGPGKPHWVWTDGQLLVQLSAAGCKMAPSVQADLVQAAALQAQKKQASPLNSQTTGPFTLNPGVHRRTWCGA